MLTVILLAAILVVGASMLFSSWLEEDCPSIFTKTVPGRVTAIIFEQPAVVMVLVVNAVLLPFAFLSELLVFPHRKGETAEYWADLVDAAVDYYTEAIPHFIAHGHFPEPKA